MIECWHRDAATLKLVLSLVISKLDYCNSLFYNMSLENIHKLQLIQNHAARLVKKAPKRSSAKLLLKDLHWLPVKKTVLFIKLQFSFTTSSMTTHHHHTSESSSQFTPPKLRDLFVPYKKKLPKITRKNFKTFGERSFSHAVPEVWNNYQILKVFPIYCYL